MEPTPRFERGSPVLREPCSGLLSEMGKMVRTGQRAREDEWLMRQRFPSAAGRSDRLGEMGKSGTRGGSRTPIGGFGVRCPAIERRACEEKTHGGRSCPGWARP